MTHPTDVAGLGLIVLLVVVPWVILHSKGFKWFVALIAFVVGLRELKRKKLARQDDQLYAIWQEQRWKTARKRTTWPES